MPFINDNVEKSPTKRAGIQSVVSNLDGLNEGGSDA
jgi:hypothetical protein